MDVSISRWFDAHFPPLAIYYGGRDFLVATEPLLERIKEHEPNVKLVRVQKLDESEVRFANTSDGFFSFLRYYELCSALITDVESSTSIVISTLQVSFPSSFFNLSLQPCTHFKNLC